MKGPNLTEKADELTGRQQQGGQMWAQSQGTSRQRDGLSQLLKALWTSVSSSGNGA